MYAMAGNFIKISTCLSFVLKNLKCFFYPYKFRTHIKSVQKVQEFNNFYVVKEVLIGKLNKI